MTLAGLPESLGCFSLANSPVASDAGNHMSEDESTASSDDDDDDPMNSDRKASSGSTTSTSASDLDAVECGVTSPIAPESHYPSPAFTSYSPTSLQGDHLSNLHAILENDPVPSRAFQQPPPHPSPPPTAQPEFDFEEFAASIEGPGPAANANLARRMSSNIPTTLEELLSNTANDLSAPVPIALTAEEKAKAAATAQKPQSGVERYPTPPSGTLGSNSLALHPEPHTTSSFEASASFDLAAHINSIISHADADQQARDRAATAAMYSSGFGVSPGAHVNLNYGLPTPMPTYAQPAPAPATSQSEQASGLTATTATSSSLSLPVLSSPLGAGSPASVPRESSFFAAALSATYATTYPSLSLPVAGFDLPNSTSLKSNTPTTFDLRAAMNGYSSPLSMSAPADSSSGSASHFDRLAKAWDQRQRAAALANAQQQADKRQPQINLRSPFAHPAKSTPAFYIPASGGPASPPSSASSAASPSGGFSDGGAMKTSAALSLW